MEGVLGITPLPNFPFDYPWIFVSYNAATYAAVDNAHNPYSFNTAEGFMCPLISHEIFATMGDEDTHHFRYFDNSAPSMQHVYFAKTLPDGTYDPNGYTVDAKGVAHFPSLLSVVPSFFAFVIEEAGDPVSTIETMKFNSFLINGYLLSNYPTKQSFNCYDSSPHVYDRMGHMQYPYIPYGGLHVTIYFTDQSKGVTYYALMPNYGPLNGTQINEFSGHYYNYPPFPVNTPFVTFLAVLAGTPTAAAAKKGMKLFNAHSIRSVNMIL